MTNYHPLWIDRQCPCRSPGDIYVTLDNRKLMFICVDCGKTWIASGALLNDHLQQIYDLLVMADKERGVSYEE